MKIHNIMPIIPINHWLDWGKAVAIDVAIVVGIFIVIIIGYKLYKRRQKKNE